MQLADIKRFIDMAMKGNESIDERLALILKQKQLVEQQIEALTNTLKTLEFKKWYYETAKEAGTTEIPRHMTWDELPEEFRETRKRLRGE